MQTFLPLPDFTESAKVLDYKRLGKQRIEAFQILKVILNPNPTLTYTIVNGNYIFTKAKKVAWINHPATRMWRNYPSALCLYGIRICEEWIRQGYRDSLLGRFNLEYEKFEENQIEIPPFVKDEKFNSSHRASLLFKNYSYYSRFGWSEEPKMEYFWPV